MKRVLILFMFLGVLYSGAWAQGYKLKEPVVSVSGTNIKNETLYVIKVVLRNQNNYTGYLYQPGSSNNYVFVKPEDSTPTSENYIWKIEGTSNQFKLKSVPTNRYIHMPSDRGWIDLTSTSSNAVNLTVSGNGVKASSKHNNLDDFIYGHNIANEVGGRAINFWAANSPSNNATFEFFEVEEEKADINITITYRTSNNSWTVNRTATDGATLNANNYAVDFYKNFVFAAGTNTTVSETNKNFTITCEEDFPFEVGKLCRIQTIGKSAQTAGHYKDYFVNGASIYYEGTIPTNGNIWYFEHASNTDPYLFRVINYASKRYLSLTDGTRRIAAATTDEKGSSTAPFADNTTYFYIRKGQSDVGGFCLQHPKYPQTCVSTHISESKAIGGWAADNEQGALTNGDNALRVLPIESFTATLNAVPGDGYYGTIYMPFNMQFSDGVKAYAAYAEGSVLKLNEVGATAPGDHGYILYKADANANGTLKVNVTTANSASYSGTNDLNGSINVGKALPNLGTYTYYVLGKKNEKMGFYQYTVGTYPTTKTVYRANSSTANVNGFLFEFGNDPLVTAIESLKTTGNGSQSIYDLQGRRIQKAMKGLNIINGQKVIR